MRRGNSVLAVRHELLCRDMNQIMFLSFNLAYSVMLCIHDLLGSEARGLSTSAGHHDSLSLKAYTS
jgi:hypothetical protein